MTAILGRNGCGKSSLFNIAFGNLKPKYILIRLNNKLLLKPLYSTGFVKYLHQYNFVPTGMKLSQVFKLFHADWTVFVAHFEAFSHHQHSKFKAQSYGEKRLVETYIILKTESQIMILDEPFSHLSPIHIERVKYLISEEKERKAIIISDHICEHIIDNSDTIYLLQNGTTKKVENHMELENCKCLSKDKLSN